MTYPRWVLPVTRSVLVATAASGLIDAAGDGELGLAQFVAAAAAVAVGWLAGADANHHREGWRAVLLLSAAGPAAWVLAGGDSASAGWFVLVFLAGQAGVTLPLSKGAFVFAALLATIGAAAIAEPNPGWGNWVSGAASGFGGGALLRKQGELAERSKANEAARERARLAREMHDVVAHTLAVTVLHLGAARVAIDHETDRAADALAEAERLARASMTELRRIVGSLADGDAARAPAASDVVALIEEYRRAGVDVELRLDGDLAGVDAPRGLVLYRVVQEALANAARHAPGAPVAVGIGAGPTEVTVEVDNPLPAGVAAGAPGHGLHGMAARASAVGGTAAAGPEGDRWVVRAELPGGDGCGAQPHGMD